jgi:hypothetical protein
MFNLEDSSAAIILISESIISINLETPKAVVILKIRNCYCEKQILLKCQLTKILFYSFELLN